MKKILWLVIFMVLATSVISFADRKSNLYLVTTGVDTTTKYRTIVLPYGAGDISIINNDSADPVWIARASGTTTCTYATCYELVKGMSLDWYDLRLDYVTLVYKSGTEASPIAISVTY